MMAKVGASSRRMDEDEGGQYEGDGIVADDEFD
jgi:hypothetical protein